MSTQNNYYDQLKPVIESALDIFEDGKVTMSEVWMFMLTLGDAMRVVLDDVKDLSDDDLAQLKSAASQLYDDFVLPLDLPGPDFFVDPLLRNGILPGLVEGAFRLAQNKLAKEGTDDGGGETEVETQAAEECCEGDGSCDSGDSE